MLTILSPFFGEVKAIKNQIPFLLFFCGQQEPAVVVKLKYVSFNSSFCLICVNSRVPSALILLASYF